jgi:uncharacterized membrane protein YfcA
LPFLVTSLPAAFIGGYFKITDRLYAILLYLVLTFVAIRLLFFSKRQDDSQPLRPVQPGLALAIGLGIGLLSGMVGIGGGIFLSPLIIISRWGSSKQASAIAAAFIVLNSISGLLGRILWGAFMLDGLSLSLLPLALFAALAGSYFGAQRLSGLNLRRTLGTVMSLVVTNFWLTFWR